MTIARHNTLVITTVVDADNEQPLIIFLPGETYPEVGDSAPDDRVGVISSMHWVTLDEPDDVGLIDMMKIMRSLGAKNVLSLPMKLVNAGREIERKHAAQTAQA